MSAALLRFNDLERLGLRALYALAESIAREVDAGANKRHMLERIMWIIADKSVMLVSESPHS